MSERNIPEFALGRLRVAKSIMLKRNDMEKIASEKTEVVEIYGPAFQPGAIETIDEDVLRSFFYIENNKHWSSLYRQVNRVCADMSVTRAALAELVDESRPIAERMQAAADIKGFGKGIMTAILQVAYPEEYGVWNGTSNNALASLGILPDFPRGSRFGERYEAVNDVLVVLANELDLDLWSLDMLWWYLDVDPDEETEDVVTPALGVEQVAARDGKASRFMLERHLHDYMFDNWHRLELAADWDIYALDGEPDAGYEFYTSIGKIDLLARHKREPRWLVIELKREKTSDVVVGQVLRYMGWVQKNLATNGESVEGMIIATQAEPRLHYALSMVRNVSFKTYEVEFRLADGPGLDAIDIL